MIIVLAIIIIGYHLIKDAMDDAEMRGWARSKGYDTYPSRTGMRYTDTNEKYYSSKRYYAEKYGKK